MIDDLLIMDNEQLKIFLESVESHDLISVMKEEQDFEKKEVLFSKLEKILGSDYVNLIRIAILQCSK
jgi:hypothetical protein